MTEANSNPNAEQEFDLDIGKMVDDLEQGGGKGIPDVEGEQPPFHPPFDDDEGEERAQEPSEPQENLIEVNVEGSVKKLSLQELKDGYNRTSNYTRNKQALAGEKAEFERDKQAFLDSLERQHPPAFTPEYPEQRQPIGYQPPQAQPQEFASPGEQTNFNEIQGLKKELRSIHVSRQEEQNRAIWNRITTARKDFQAEHPDLSDEQVEAVMNVMNRNEKAPTLQGFNDAYKATIDLSEVKKAAVQEYLDKKKEDALKTPMEPAGGTPPGPEPIDLSKYEWGSDEMTALMERDLEKGG